LRLRVRGQEIFEERHLAVHAVVACCFQSALCVGPSWLG